MEPNPRNSLVAVMLVALFGSGYALLPRDGDLAGQPVAAVQEAFEYFPAQYVNHARAYEEHIQAF